MRGVHPARRSPRHCISRKRLFDLRLANAAVARCRKEIFMSSREMRPQDPGEEPRLTAAIFAGDNNLLILLGAEFPENRQIARIFEPLILGALSGLNRWICFVARCRG